ncbi:MAG: lysostaphin resistance A-like protein [Terriglobales bacterium]
MFYHDASWWGKLLVDEPEKRPSLSSQNAGPESAHSPVFPEAKSTFLHSFFVGPDGLRAGWRFAIYLAAFFALLFLISFVTKPFLHLHPHQKPPVWVLLLGELESLLAAIIPALAIARLEKRPFGAYGLPSQGAFGKQFWIGVIWGICAITLLLAVMRGVGVFYFGGLALHGARILKFATFWGALFLVVGLFEEFVARGYTQFTLARGMGFWPAAVLLSAAFGAIHLGNPGEAWVGALAAACIGLFFCLTLQRTGTLWFAVGMHASWDWGESFLYSVPDSGQVAPGHLLSSSFHGARWLTGGSVGPEGSVLVFVLIAGMWLLFDRLYPTAQIHHNQLAPVSPAGYQE